MNIGSLLKKIFNPKPTENYVSNIDKFQEQFDASHEKSESQKKEIAKHAKIAHKRDNKVPTDLKSKIWGEF